MAVEPPAAPCRADGPVRGVDRYDIQRRPATPDQGHPGLWRADAGVRHRRLGVDPVAGLVGRGHRYRSPSGPKIAGPACAGGGGRVAPVAGRRAASGGTDRQPGYGRDGGHRDRPVGHRKRRRKPQRRGDRPGVLVSDRRLAGAADLQDHQYRRQHDRLSHPAS